MTFDQLIDYYNCRYHETNREAEKKIDDHILLRINLYNQIGILLKRNLIDQDMLFGLLEAEIELDSNILWLALNAHRKSHKAPNMFFDTQYLWGNYLKWRKRRGE